MMVYLIYIISTLNRSKELFGKLITSPCLVTRDWAGDGKKC